MCSLYLPSYLSVIHLPQSEVLQAVCLRSSAECVTAMKHSRALCVLEESQLISPGCNFFLAVQLFANFFHDSAGI